MIRGTAYKWLGSGTIQRRNVLHLEIGSFDAGIAILRDEIASLLVVISLKLSVGNGKNLFQMFDYNRWSACQLLRINMVFPHFLRDFRVVGRKQKEGQSNILLGADIEHLQFLQGRHDERVRLGAGVNDVNRRGVLEHSPKKTEQSRFALVLIADPFAFGIDPMTVYYLPDTTGWGYFDGFPTVLWNPTIQVADGSFGVKDNQFGFNVSGTADIPFVVEACTNLADPMWQPLQTNTLAGGIFYFGDSQWTNYPGRFYRIHWP
jgi:hypothetical protein